MARYAPRRIDGNQQIIVEALEAAGCDVIDATMVGDGFPDLIVGKNKKILLIEVKNPASKGKLNKLQEKFFNHWKDYAVVVHNVDEALDALKYFNEEST